MSALIGIRAFLGKVPREVWYALAVALALFLLWRWHDGKVDAAFTAGATEQAKADRKAVAAAERAATKAQADLKARTAATSAAISKGTDNALQKDNARLARSYDDLRMRWAAYRADQGGTGQGGPAGATSAAGVTDDAYCTAQGWVSFDTAATAAQAADEAIAKDDAWRQWWAAQQEAWPK